VIKRNFPLQRGANGTAQAGSTALLYTTPRAAHERAIREHLARRYSLGRGGDRRAMILPLSKESP